MFRCWRLTRYLTILTVCPFELGYKTVMAERHSLNTY